ncbi:phenylalanine 4-monooxygenase [Streptomyces sp. NPDC048644]|uniref:phenylalanine 4-monooxygenase n=1 Tax=Streptomyces sp. NPDC048644 TaxID=3365582 RepID=UPI003717F155
MSDEPTPAPVFDDGDPGSAQLHPSLSDPAYRRRRDRIAALAEGHPPGRPAPFVTYTEAEHATWRHVHTALRTAGADRICTAVREAREATPFPDDGVPQHAQVADRLHALTGFGLTPAGGFVPTKRFLGLMADDSFYAVQYVRHPAMPRYTPEPDIIHDVLGHGTHLASPFFAALYRVIGRAAARLEGADALDLLNRVYFFSLECGVVREHKGTTAYGAALLSSPSELGRLPTAPVHDWDLAAMTRTPCQAVGYQPGYFAVRSLQHLADSLHAFCETLDEDTGRRLNLPPLHARGSLPPRV